MSSLSKLKKKYVLKIPQNIKVLYCDKKNIISFISQTQTKSIKPAVKILLVNKSDIIITDALFSNTLCMNYKTIKKLQGTWLARIRHALIEVTYNLYYQLNLVGVGYRVFYYNDVKNQLYLKLGYSHLIYFRIPESLKVYSQKFTKLFIYGDSSYDHLKQVVAQIRKCKVPEPYKGKGILYAYEKVSLKKGKKI